MTAADPPGRSFLYDDLHLTVFSPSRSHLGWLEDFLVPHFSVGEVTSPSFEVGLQIDGGAWRELRKGFEPSGPISAFAFDSGPRSLPFHKGEDGTLTLWEEGFRAFLEVSRDRRRTRVVIPEDHSRIRILLMRIVREFAMNSAVLQGDFFLHASCLVDGDRSIIIAGPKNSGKTTLLVDACLHTGALWLGNDRIRVHHRDGRCRIRGMPVVVSLRAGTLALFPGVAEKIAGDGWHSRLGRGESARENPPVTGKKGRRWITPGQFSVLVAAGQASEGHRPVVLLPRLTGLPGTFDLHPVPKKETQGHLEDIVFGAGRESFPTPVFNPAEAASAASLRPPEGRHRLFAGEVPFVACEVHRDFSRSPGTAAEWMRAILDRDHIPG